MSEFYPAFLNLSSQKCLVIGGGAVAERKIKHLLRCCAEVHVVSPDLTPFLSDLVEQGRIIYFKRKFLPQDINAMFVVISAAGDKEVNSYLASQCLNNKFLLNIVDDPRKCNFFMPSILKRGKLQIAISTSGASPLLAHKLRKRLEDEFGNEYEQFLDILAEARKEVFLNVAEPEKRKQIYQALIDSDILELLKTGDDAKVKERISQCLYW